MSDLHHKEYGSGLPIILLHGFIETNGIWNKIIPHLESNFRIITLDLPGFGKSKLPKPLFTLEDIADLITDWILKNKIEKPIILGHSLGGYITLNIIAQNEHLFAAFGLIHSTSYSDSNSKKQRREKVVSFIQKNGVARFAEEFIPNLFFDKLKNNTIINEIIDQGRSCTEESLIGYTRAMKNRKDLHKILDTSEIPKLFVYGENDQVISKSEALKQSQKLDKRCVHKLKDTGHMGMYEQTEVLSKIISDFALLVKNNIKSN